MDKKYKGFCIEFDEFRDCFIAYKDGIGERKSQSLKDLKAQIDVSSKKEFKRLEIFCNNAFEIQQGQITSFNSLEKTVWITYGKEKDREEVNLSWDKEKVVHKNQKNLQLLQERLSLISQIEKLEKERDKIDKKITSYTYEEVCKITGENPIE